MAASVSRTRSLSVVTLAVLSRCALLLLMAGVRSLVPRYDTSTDAYLRDGSAPRGRLDSVVYALLGSAANWDGLHFLRVAEAGYDAEHQHAFFPLLPNMMHRMASTPLYPLRAAGLLSTRACLLLAGALLSSSAFVAATYVLHILSHRVFKSDAAARTAALLFILSPAGVFTVALYTESVFALLSFAGMLACSNALAGAEALRHWAKRATHAAPRGAAPMHESAVAAGALHAFDLSSVAGNMWTDLTFGATCFAAAGMTRSNGMLLVMFTLATAALLWRAMHEILSKQGVSRSVLGSWFARHVAVTVAASALVVAPYVIWQWYATFKYCTPAPSVVRSVVRVMAGAHLPDAIAASTLDAPDWCPRAWYTLLPPMYTSIQRTYWDVGFLRFYQWKHAPQVALAAPMLLLAAAAVMRLRTTARSFRGTLAEIRDVCTRCALPTRPVPSAASGDSDDDDDGSQSAYDMLTTPAALPFLAYWLLQVGIALTSMHLNVITRFLIASPAMYWFLAAAAEDTQPIHKATRVSFGTLIVASYVFVSLGFQLVGTSLFTSFLPWT